MAVLRMNQADNDRHEYQATLAAGQTSDWLIIPRNKTGPVTLGLICSATARFEYTFSPLEEVLASSVNVYVRAWSKGDVVDDADESIVSPVTAVRAVNGGAAALFWEVLV